MNKKQAQQWLLEAGLTSSYSGKQRTLFVDNVSQAQLDYWALNVNFTIKAQ